MTARILLIGSPRWEASLRRNWAIMRFSSAKRAMTFADAQPFSAIIVDAVSMHTSGARICRTMREHYPGCPLILIQPHRYAKGEISTDVTLHPPVSARQLIGIVSRIIRQDPREIVACGPFALNCTTRTLRTNRQEVQLSPKLAALIALFLSHPNQVLSHATILERVWKTDYLGDTRTLYVHIRHARELLEEDPQQPRFLKTVRGAGYRLAIPPEKTKDRQPRSVSET